MPDWFRFLTWPQALVLAAVALSTGALGMALGEVGKAAISRNRRITWYRGRRER